MLGYAAQEDPFLKRLCREVGCIVVTVDYSLAPERRAPTAAEEGCLAYLWLREQGDEFGVDTARIGLAGASGGGGIAAATALMVRDRRAPTPHLLSLTYPMIDNRNETPSSREITDIGVWDRHTNALAWRAILGELAGTAEVTPYQAPARAEDLAGLPPTFIAAGELDVFRDENLRFAAQLVAGGVSTELHLYPGAYHAWDLFAPASDLAVAFLQACHGYLRRRFRQWRRRIKPVSMIERIAMSEVRKPLTSLELRSKAVPEGRLELSLERVDVGDPGPGEVVVRIEAAPVNPTDISMLLGPADPASAKVQGEGKNRQLAIPLSAAQAASLERRMNLSLCPGLEGAGVVVAAGAGGEDLVGRTVELCRDLGDAVIRRRSVLACQ